MDELVPRQVIQHHYIWTQYFMYSIVKDAAFFSMRDFPEKDIKFSKVVMCVKLLQ